MSVSLKKICPAVGRVIVASICMSVVLPAPFGPSRPRTPPFSESESSRTPYWPPRNRLETDSTRSMGPYTAIRHPELRRQRRTWARGRTGGPLLLPDRQLDLARLDKNSRRRIDHGAAALLDGQLRVDLRRQNRR